MSKLNLKSLGPCLLAIAIDAMGFGLVYPIMAAIFSDPHSGIISADANQHLRNFYLGLGYGVYPLCMFFGSSLMGELSDGYGRRKILLLCVFGLALSYLLMAVGALMPSIALLLIGRGLSGLMAGCQGIAQAAITDVSTPETKAYNMSIMSIAFSAGVIVGPVLGGVTSDRTIAPFFNYGTPFLLVAALSVVCGLWTFWFYRDAVAPKGGARIDLLLPLRIIYEAGKHHRVAFLSVVFFLMQVGYGLYLQTIMLVLQTRFQYTSSQLGLFSGLIGICFVFGLMVVVRLMLKVWGVVDIAKTGLLIAGIGQILSALLPHEGMLWALGMVVGCFDMVAYTTMYTAYSDAVAVERQGWALGVAGSVMAIAWVVTGFLTNLLPVLGELGLLTVGGVSFILSFLMMMAYGRKWSRPTVRVGTRVYD
ncbi:MFS transporter [Paraburkholderia megapolitana]|jgi:DHA1 family tetracycline resistance protein-like MFS transporter|uniref:Predicted arabinose efflux permease, MFS family n=1 Tax=Paraburkholderia megapolitana TaxID=420953 RepID=A0A1I3G4F5_9BURK|nr:MFS transporter [Paraburkholderia megapolitana]QDQ82695.1 MFS transporter [Paraburkholderia megapolitana]SFI18061.1 Predicted arabinose efflux permease, MFS family [Paraburkholderia megapolitana]